ncbi:hypothetical protein LIER_13903 [Lithospermum erythrorhizon]|uniref:Uncharacterized protein n=1 Tax=Lithospermum erythrorhizon TaxID=34254 RepID=A0AAV3PZL9_LITER
MVVPDKSAGDVSEDVPERDGEDVSYADVVTEGVEVPSTEGLGVDVESLEGLKDSTPTGEDVLEPTFDDSGKDPVVEGMDVDLPTIVDTEPLIAKAADGGMLPSVTDICVETADIQEVSQEDAESQKEDIDIAKDVEGPAPGFITISPKLMQGTHVADIPLVAVDTGGTSGSGTDETTKILRADIKHLEVVIQSSLDKKYVLEAGLMSLSGEDDVEDEPPVGGYGVEAPQA